MPRNLYRQSTRLSPKKKARKQAMFYSIHDTLVRVRELLSDESRHSKHYFAVDAGGGAVKATSPRACKWCLVGAFDKVNGHEDARQYLEDISGIDDLLRFNETHTHTEVIALLDSVIRKD